MGMIRGIPARDMLIHDLIKGLILQNQDWEMNYRWLEKKRKCRLCVSGWRKKGAHQMTACISPATQQEDNTVKAATEENVLASNASGRHRGAS